MSQLPTVQWIPAKKGTDQGDWELNNECFSLARTLWIAEGRKPWSVDGAADIHGRNAKCSQFYHRDHSFLKVAGEQLAGQSVWCNPDFRKCGAYLEKLVELRRVGVPSCVVAPYTPDRKWWSVAKSNFQLACVIPRKWRGLDGQYIFSRPVGKAESKRESPGPPPWDVCIWFSKPVASSELTVGNIEGYAYKEPTTGIDIGDLCVFAGTALGEHVSVLFDDGALSRLTSDNNILALRQCLSAKGAQIAVKSVIIIANSWITQWCSETKVWITCWCSETSLLTTHNRQAMTWANEARAKKNHYPPHCLEDGVVGNGQS